MNDRVGGGLLYRARLEHVNRLMGGVWRRQKTGQLEDSAETGKHEIGVVPSFSWLWIAAAREANGWIDNFL